MGARITLRDAPRGKSLLAGIEFQDGVAENVALSANLRGFFEQPLHGAIITEAEPEEAPKEAPEGDGDQKEIDPPAEVATPKGRGKAKPAEQSDVTTIDLKPGSSGDEVAAAIIGA